jgi:hypothetical protein
VTGEGGLTPRAGRGLLIHTLATSATDTLGYQCCPFGVSRTGGPER